MAEVEVHEVPDLAADSHVRVVCPSLETLLKVRLQHGVVDNHVLVFRALVEPLDPPREVAPIVFQRRLAQCTGFDL